MANEESKAKLEKRRQKIPRKVTPTSLENIALYYLERFATSSQNLRQVLLRRVQRSAKHHDTDVEACAGLIDDLIRRYLASGLLDDQAYARAQASSLNRCGKSLRAISVHLRQKAIPSGIIDETLDALKEEIGEPDLAAAIAYARKRRIGPYRNSDKPPENLDKELAALARSGFSYSLAKRIVEADNIDELENTL
ncbi:MAG: regulatory protein RecX [Rhodospirillales bacterium]|nr:regulatory protein RecX [Rhodospirillales bacterium]